MLDEKVTVRSGSKEIQEVHWNNINDEIDNIIKFLMGNHLQS